MLLNNVTKANTTTEQALYDTAKVEMAKILELLLSKGKTYGEEHNALENFDIRRRHEAFRKRHLSWDKPATVPGNARGQAFLRTGAVGCR